MRKLCHYGRFLQYTIERDTLNASFIRMGSGFVTDSILKEAVETQNRITQILYQYRLLLEAGNKFESKKNPIEMYNGRVENNQRLS